MVAALCATGCDHGGSSGDARGAQRATTARTGPSHTAPAPSPRTGSRRLAPLAPARCPHDVSGCVVATGRVAYVEKVDPDGDGDAHYVVFGGRVTGPGLSVIDLPPRLHPPRLPGIGDTVSAAGPVAVGSRGQRQVEALAFRFRRR